MPNKSNIVKENKNQQVIIAETVENKASNNSHASSQRQLVELAKNFALEGALLPPEKQMPVADRAAKREQLILLNQQQNLEAIIQKAVSFCDNENAVEKTDKDWFNSFIELAENISNPTMQNLWAKILASQINKPGSFSLNTLQVFRHMSVFDAKLFAKACALACHDQKKKNYRIISGSSQIPSLFNLFDKQRQNLLDLNSHGLSYSDILYLAENKLLFQQESESNVFNKSGQLTLNYNGTEVNLMSVKAGCVLRFYKFTPIGIELARLISDTPEATYLQALTSKISRHFSVLIVK